MSNQRKIEGMISNLALEELQNREFAHSKGKETAKEKIESLLDEKSFVEVELLHNRGIVAGYGTINDRPVCIWAQDTVNDNGALTSQNIQKVIKVFDMAVKVGCPIISIIENAKISIEDNLEIMQAISKLVEKQVSVSGVIPQVAVLFDSVIGGMAYSVALNDFIYTIKSNDVTANLEKAKKLNNADYKKDVNDLLSFEFTNKIECFNEVRKLFEYIPDNNLTDTEIFESDLNITSEVLNTIIGQDYDVRTVINEIADNGFVEIKSDLANNSTIGFSRIGGRAVGIVANSGAGILKTSDFNKMARFVRFCDAFNLPIVTLVNTKGYDINSNNEIINAGARLFYAYAEATVPKINVVLGNAFGSMYIAMGNVGKDMTFAWPNAEICVANTESYVSIMDSDSIINNEVRAQKIEEYKENNESLLLALEKGYIDDIIEPATTRQRIISALELFINKRENRPVKKHGNIPV
jgi:acetyl-CoA carboxylase carboxyltransferase component